MKSKRDEIRKKEKNLARMLDAYEVNIPDFPMKKSMMSRIANWLFAPAKIPFPEAGYTTTASLYILILPFVLVIFTLVSVTTL